MSFFYSQHLTNDQRPILETQGPTTNPITGLPRGSGHLVWHSNTGASGRRNTNTETMWQYKPVRPSAPREKVVRFSTVEVQPFHLDRSLISDVFYTRAELKAFRQGRFDDATALRTRRDGAPHHRPSVDDVDIATRPRSGCVATLLSMAFEDDALDAAQDDERSIRGVEHFVYPALQQEMIRRKKEVQREVLDFARSKRPDPQGWRLAELSRARSRWARGVATEKGRRWCGGDAGLVRSGYLGKHELEGFEQSRDEPDRMTMSLKGSVSWHHLDQLTGPIPMDQLAGPIPRRASVADTGGRAGGGAPSPMAWLSSQSHDELDQTTGPWEGRAAGATERRGCSIVSSISMMGLSSKSFDELDQSTEPWKGSAGVTAEGGCDGDAAPCFAVGSSSKSHDELDRSAGPWKGSAAVANEGGRGSSVASNFAMGLSSKSFDELDQSTEPWKGSAAVADGRGRDSGVASNLVVGLSSKSFDELDQSTVPWKGSAGVADESGSDQAARPLKGSADVADEGGRSSGASSRLMAWLSSKSHDELDQSTTPWEGGSSSAGGSAQATRSPRSPKQSTGSTDEGDCSSGASSRSMAWLSSKSHDELDQSTTPWEGGSSFTGGNAQATRSPKGSAGLADEGGCSGGASSSSMVWISPKSHDELDQSTMPLEGGSSCARGNAQATRSPKGSAGSTDEGGCSGGAPSKSMAWLSPKSYDKLAQSARPWKRSAGSAAAERGSNPGTRSSKGSADPTDGGGCSSRSLAWLSSKSHDELDQSTGPWNHGVASSFAMGLSLKSHDQVDQSARPWKGSAGCTDERKGTTGDSPGVKVGTENTGG